MRLVSGLAAFLLVMGVGGSSASEAAADMQGTGGLSEAGFQAFLPQLRRDAERAGIRRETIDRTHRLAANTTGTVIGCLVAVAVRMLILNRDVLVKDDLHASSCSIWRSA